jgi:phage-related protein
MPFAYSKSERGVIVVTHGFFKKKDKTPKAEIDRAWRIYEEDQSQRRLTIVKKARQ